MSPSRMFFDLEPGQALVIGGIVVIPIEKSGRRVRLKVEVSTDVPVSKGDIEDVTESRPTRRSKTRKRGKFSTAGS